MSGLQSKNSLIWYLNATEILCYFLVQRIKQPLYIYIYIFLALWLKIKTFDGSSAGFKQTLSYMICKNFMLCKQQNIIKHSVYVSYFKASVLLSLKEIWFVLCWSMFIKIKQILTYSIFWVVNMISWPLLLLLVIIIIVIIAKNGSWARWRCCWCCCWKH